MWENHLCLLLLGSPLVPFLSGAPLEPGQPGAPWTEEEVEVTREKVDLFFSYPGEGQTLFFDLIFFKVWCKRPLGAGHAGLQPGLLAKPPCGKTLSRGRARRLQSTPRRRHIRTKVL